MSTGFGIIGCGMIAIFHARAIAEIRGARTRGLLRQVPAAADKLAAETGCKAYHDLAAMLADPAVDVVTIGTPSGAHMEPAVAAARAGKHVIVEKPLEITLRRCDKIIEACEKAGVVLSAIFPSRFHDSSRRIEAGGRPGPLRPAHPRRRHRQVVSQPSLLRQRRMARHVGTRRRRGADEPGHPQRRSVDLADGPGGRDPCPDGPAGPRANRRRRHRHGHASVCQRRPGGHRGQHGRLSRLFQADRNPRQRGIRGDGGRGHRQVGLCQAAADAMQRFARQMSERKSSGGGAADPKAIGHHGHMRQFQDVLRDRSRRKSRR